MDKKILEKELYKYYMTVGSLKRLNIHHKFMMTIFRPLLKLLEKELNKK